MGSRFDLADRRSDDLIVAIDHAAHTVSHAITGGLGLIALQIALHNNGGDAPAIAKAIEAEVTKLKALTDRLHKSVPPV